MIFISVLREITKNSFFSVYSPGKNNFLSKISLITSPHMCRVKGQWLSLWDKFFLIIVVQSRKLNLKRKKGGKKPLCLL